MITDNDGLLPILIDNCTFMDNEVSNEGPGLYIDRAYQNVTIQNSLFKGNKISNGYNNIEGYGISLHAVGVGSIYLLNCEFEIVKQNEATSISILGLSDITFECCTLNATGEATNPATAFYIYTNETIKFIGSNCYVDHGNGNNFHFKVGQDLTNLSICSSNKKIKRTLERFIDLDKESISVRKERKNFQQKNIPYIKVFEEKNNTEDNSGAAVFSTNSEITLTKCTFYDCDVIISIDKGLDGGAIYTKNCSNKYIDCSFTKCVAYRYGGAIYDVDPKSVSISGCKFDKNSAQQGSSYSLTGLHEITVSNSIFTHSDQFVVRPEFLHSSTLSLEKVNVTTIDNCQFIDMEQPGAYFEASTLTIKNSKFNKLYVFISSYHSAMLTNPGDNPDGKYILSNVSFNDCQSTSAGLMNIPAVSLEMENVNLTKSKNSYWYSHGFIITDSNTNKVVSIKNCLFQDCQSFSEGAGLYIDRTSNTITIEDCKFIKNTVEGAYGASIHSKGFSSLTLSSCKFDFTKTNDDISVMFSNLKSITMNGCCFFSDGKKGGHPFHISSDTLIVFDSLNCFNDNKESNFQFAQGQDTSKLNLNCKDCVPVSPTAYVPTSVLPTPTATTKIIPTKVIPTSISPTKVKPTSISPTQVLPSVNPDDQQQSGGGGKKINSAQVAGIVIGIIIVVAVIVMIVFFVMRKGKAFNFQKMDKGAEDSSQSILSTTFSSANDVRAFDETFSGD